MKVTWLDKGSIYLNQTYSKNSNIVEKKYILK